jgi:DNA-binding LacI/PurR family transcriptional regulator
VEGDFTFQSGLECGVQLFAGATRPTAVFASNDDMAFGVMQAAQREGLSVPADVSVVGFDDAPGAQFSVPQLTTIRQPVAEMAEIAARMLIDTARGTAEGAARAHQVAYALMARGSSAAPAIPFSRRR